ncbi:MAG: RNA polymerase-binding protein RbpA, partial [Actinomycetaceae bacterium UMB1218B]|nr:RNA polymerase-binding protein RbpA [Actinomycetaceae bacterium UMB1218B]
CGSSAELIGDAPEDEETKPAKAVRTHWDMLRERRSLEELEVVLNEQLTAYREGRLQPEGHYRKG